MKLGLFGLLATTAVLSTGCEPYACTLIGCDSTLIVNVAGPGGADLADGTFEVAFDLDGETYGTTCAYGPDNEFSCEEVEGEGRFDVWTSTRGGTFDLQVYSTSEEAPTTYDIEIFSGDALVLEHSATPDYEVSEPNGEGCGTCQFAREELTIDLTPEHEED
ncbi:MAG: hypothetical protein AAF799_13145 [Myxococcota bacterium]